MPKGELAAAKDSVTTALTLGFSIGFSMLFGMAFLTSSFCYFLIRERQTGAKHLQVVSGVGPFAFWVASFTWDFINYMIPCLVLLIVFAGFQVRARGLPAQVRARGLPAQVRARGLPVQVRVRGSSTGESKGASSTGESKGASSTGESKGASSTGESKGFQYR